MLHIMSLSGHRHCHVELTLAVLAAAPPFRIRLNLPLPDCSGRAPAVLCPPSCKTPQQPQHVAIHLISGFDEEASILNTQGGLDYLASSLDPRRVDILQYFGTCMLRSSLCRLPWGNRGHSWFGRCILGLASTEKGGNAALLHRPNGMHLRCADRKATLAGYCHIAPTDCSSRPGYRERKSENAYICCVCQLESRSWSHVRSRGRRDHTQLDDQQDCA